MVWTESTNVRKEDVVYPCRQVYIWLITKDNQVVIVSKDGAHWQLPGGKPEVGESLLETATREVSEETGLDISGLVQQARMFGYYVVREPEANPGCYLQIRYILALPQDASSLALRVDAEDENQATEDVIKFVRCVPLGRLADFIPWMPKTDEYRYILASVAPLSI